MSDVIMNGNGSQGDKKKPIRVGVVGCFDMVHFGHANFLRKAKLLGDYLIVGVHDDDEIRKHKGPPVFTQEERYSMVRAVKWVDEVVEGVPFCPSMESLAKYNLDFVCGDNFATTSDEKDPYYEPKKINRFRGISRTQGVSTTDIVGRMLLVTKTHQKREGEDLPDEQPWTGVSKLLATTQRIVQFSEGREAKPTDKVVYVPGAFDCFHFGHLKILEKAATLGDYVVVGLHTDSEVNRYSGSNYPIMNIHERVLSVLACRHVDEVVIGAPYNISKDIMSHFNVSVVVQGNSKVFADANGEDPYAEPKAQKKFQLIGTESGFTTEDLVQRIIEHRRQYQERNVRSLEVIKLSEKIRDCTAVKIHR